MLTGLLGSLMRSRQSLRCRMFTLQGWDINDPEAESPDPFNIVVARNLSQTAKDLPRALASLHSSIEDGGFLVLQELTGALLLQPDLVGMPC